MGVRSWWVGWVSDHFPSQHPCWKASAQFIWCCHTSLYYFSSYQISKLPSHPLQSCNLLDPLILLYAWWTAHFKKAESVMGLEWQNYRMIEATLLEEANTNHQLQLLAQHSMALRITPCTWERCLNASWTLSMFVLWLLSGELGVWSLRRSFELLRSQWSCFKIISAGILWHRCTCNEFGWVFFPFFLFY